MPAGGYTGFLLEESHDEKQRLITLEKATGP
jgi:hypothetical protein